MAATGCAKEVWMTMEITLEPDGERSRGVIIAMSWHGMKMSINEKK